MQIIDSLVPIFAVIGLGIALRRKGFLNEDITQGFNRFAYYFALPLFLFYKLGSAPPVVGTANKLMVTLLLATVSAMLIGWIATLLFRTSPKSQGALIQACFRGNLAFMGLPLILFATAAMADEARTSLESAVLVALPPTVILYNVASVAVLAIFNEENKANISWKKVLFSIVTNPLLIACVAGLLVQISSTPIPTAIYRTCEVLGASGFPMALVGIGSQLAATRIRGHWNSLFIASFVKCVACPLIGYLVAIGVGLSGHELQAVLILCAVPTAVSSYVLADQMNGDSELAAGSVVVCTAISVVTLSVLFALTG